jgi:hypothetical protein
MPGFTLGILWRGLDGILTTMNGYAVLTHAPASFSDVFYATAATVIPVLFLAIAVQGQMYRDLLNAARRASLRADRGVRSIGPIGMGLAFIAWFATWSLALFLLLVGTYGELASLTALYEQHAESGVFLSTVTLVVAVAIAPASALGRFLYREARGRAPAPTALLSQPPQNQLLGPASRTLWNQANRSADKESRRIEDRGVPGHRQRLDAGPGQMTISPAAARAAAASSLCPPTDPEGPPRFTATA